MRAHIFVTGSADGLGLATAQTLLREGHQVVVHVRSEQRLGAVRDLVARAQRPWSATSRTSNRRAASPSR